MSQKILEKLSAIDFTLLDQESYKSVAEILLQKIPGITGFIEKASKDKEKKLQENFLEIKQEVINGSCTADKIEDFIGKLSEQYTHLLSQLGIIETQLESAEAMKTKLEDKVYGTRIATLPIAMIIDFVNHLKVTGWATISWDEKNGTRCEKITDYARLVDIYIEPNMQWSEKVHFTMLMGGYLPEADYNNLIESLNLVAAYNIQ